MSKLHIKKGDTVCVLAGKDKNKTGKVVRVLVDKQRAIVEGLNMVQKSQKPSAQNPQGGFVKTEAPIHISEYYRRMSRAINPYGDGRACERIVSIFSLDG